MNVSRTGVPAGAPFRHSSGVTSWIFMLFKSVILCIALQIDEDRFLRPGCRFGMRALVFSKTATFKRLRKGTAFAP
jgi:hypothetical protein